MPTAYVSIKLTIVRCTLNYFNAGQFSILDQGSLYNQIAQFKDCFKKCYENQVLAR